MDRLNYVSEKTIKNLRGTWPDDVLERYTKNPINKLEDHLLSEAILRTDFSREKEELLEEIMGRDEVDTRSLVDIADSAFYSKGNIQKKFEKKIILKLADNIAENGKKFGQYSPYESGKLIDIVYMFLFSRKNLRKKFIGDYSFNLRDLVYKYLTE